MTEHDIVYYHEQLQKNIHIVEKDQSNHEALERVRELFLVIYDKIKMIMISRQERYYGVFLMNMDLKIDFFSRHIACVSIDSYPFCIKVNPLLLGLRSLPEIIYVLCHEIEHILLNHPADGIRYNPGRDFITGLNLNIAMDASINDRLNEDIIENGFDIIRQPKGSITSDYFRDEFKLYVKSLQAFDYYFERFPKDKADKIGYRKIICFDDGDDCEIITAQKCEGIICLPSWTDSDDPDECESIIRRFVSDVCERMSGSMRGNLPGNQEEILKRLLAPPVVTWKELLKRYIGTVPYGHKKTRLRLSRHQPERYDISGHLTDRIIKLVVALDTSASMSSETLSRIMIEIFDIVGSRMCEVTIIECDTNIRRVYKARSVKDVSCEIHGRGGTSYVPVIEYVNSDRYFRDAILIYFTDGMGDEYIPRPLISRIMWVLNNKFCHLSVSTPYGQVLCMDI